MTTSSDDYDSPWKDAVTRYFPEFMAFYFPVAHGEIDWQQPYVFLEQELAQVVRDAELGRRRVDKLVRVVKRGGMDEWVFVHIDVQGRFDKKFAELVFVYNYRIYDRYVTTTDAPHRTSRNEAAPSLAGWVASNCPARRCHAGAAGGMGCSIARRTHAGSCVCPAFKRPGRLLLTHPHEKKPARAGSGNAAFLRGPAKIATLQASVS
jgi:hypothetical protein